MSNKRNRKKRKSENRESLAASERGEFLQLVRRGEDLSLIHILKNVKWDSEKNNDGSYTVTIRGTYPELNARIGVDFHYTEDEEYCWASADQVYINGTKFTDGATIAMVMALIYGDEDTATAAMAWSIFS